MRIALGKYENRSLISRIFNKPIKIDSQTEIISIDKD